MTAQVLFFYITAHRQSSNAAVIQLQIFSIILHIINFSYGMSGKLDRYTLNIMIHEALLTNGFQLIHTLKRTDRPHQIYFVVNIQLTIFEFVLAFGGHKGMIERNINICPALQEGFNATQLHRLRFTVLPFALAILLCFIEFLLFSINGCRNKNRRSLPRYILPNWIVWDDKIWDKRRAIICAVGLIWWAWSVITLEVLIIRDFHTYMRQFPDASSSEDAWSYGQIIALCCALVAFVYAVRAWFIEEMHPLAGINHYELNLTLGANLGTQDGRGRWTIFLLWVYRRITPEPNPIPKITRNNENASNQTVPATETKAPLLNGTELSQRATHPRYH